MSALVTPFGRHDRAAITERARQIYGTARGRMSWGEARTAAYREASQQMQAQARIPAISATTRAA